MAAITLKTCVSFLQPKLNVRQYGNQLKGNILKNRFKTKNEEPAVVESRFRNGKYISKYSDVPDFEKLDDDKKIETFSRQMLIVKSRIEREKNQKILLEGRHLVKDAILSGVAVENIYFNSEDTLTGLGLKKLNDLKIQRISTKDLNLWSDMASCPGIMAVCKAPNLKNPLFPERQIPVTVICDNIKESENLGAIIRCAAGTGCEKIIATSGSLDVWDSKVLRHGHGSHFLIPIHNSIHWSLIKNYLPQSFSVILTNEKILDEKMRAKSIKRRLRKIKIAQRKQEDGLLNQLDIVKKVSDGRFRSVTTLEKLKDYEMTPLPSYKYSDIGFVQDAHVVLVVGGDTDGLSAAAYKLAHENSGFLVNFSIDQSAINLNSVTMSAVMLFEICRQLHK